MVNRLKKKAIILAAGSSHRMHSKIPKQLAKIDNKPLVAYTLDVFEKCRAVDSIILVINKKFKPQFHNLVKKYQYRKIEQLVGGGRTRQRSVFNALCKISDCDYVIIHDGVRPLVSQELISRAIRAVRRFSAVSCAVKATDTIVQAKGSFIGKTLKRQRLWHIQTPQAFGFNLIIKAHHWARAKGISNASDDTQLLVGLKKNIKLISGSDQNIKITTESDLLLAKKLQKSRQSI